MNQKFFEDLEDKKEEFGIADIQLSLTTLEEVFLNIARQAELESATAEGRLVTLTLTTSGASVQVSDYLPFGSKLINRNIILFLSVHSALVPKNLSVF